MDQLAKNAIADQDTDDNDFTQSRFNDTFLFNGWKMSTISMCGLRCKSRKTNVIQVTTSFSFRACGDLPIIGITRQQVTVTR